MGYLSTTSLFIDYVTVSISVSVLYQRMDMPQSNSQNVLDLLRKRVILLLFLLSFQSRNGHKVNTSYQY